MKFRVLVVLFSSLLIFACSSSPNTMSDNPSDDTDITAEPEVNDFQDDGLFDAEGESGEQASDSGDYDPELSEDNAAVDTGDDEASAEETEEAATEPEPNPFPAPETETPKPKPVAKKKSMSKDKAATRRTTSDCNMRAKPSSGSTKLTLVPKGRKIWTEPAEGDWFKVYRKKGVGYVSKVCF